MNEQIRHYLAEHNDYLQQTLQQMEIPARRIAEAIYYALFPPGKRLRPLLVYLFGQLLNVNFSCLHAIGAAIELTHCYSLIHDDLPAMDNDDFRRGKPSCHRAFDEATAILTGDAMQALAIEIILTKLPPYLLPEQVIAVTKALVKASGPSGMVSGQSLDLSHLTQENITEADLFTIHSLKTGQLILACVDCVLAATTISNSQGNALQNFAYYFGLAFQMQDDYLDKYENSVLGKGRASDSANKKITFATLYTQAALRDLVRHYFQLAKNTLSPFADHAQDLLLFTSYMENRTK